MLRAIPKIGTRERHWLIVNEHGGWFDEYVGTKANAEAFAVECQKLVDARNAESAASRNVVYGCGTCSKPIESGCYCSDACRDADG